MMFYDAPSSRLSTLLEMNVNPRVVADLMGHTTLDMVMRYMQVPKKSQQEAIETLNDTYKMVISDAILDAQCLSEEVRGATRKNTTSFECPKYVAHPEDALPARNSRYDEQICEGFLDLREKEKILSFSYDTAVGDRIGLRKKFIEEKG